MTGERVAKIIAEHYHLNEDQVTRDVKLDAQLNCNGQDLAEIAGHLEDEFDIVIPTEDSEKWITVGDVFDYVMDKE